MLEIKQIRIGEIIMEEMLPGELVDNTETSLMSYGIVAPLMVTETNEGEYEILDGKKRALTIKMTKGPNYELDVVVVPKHFSKNELQLVMNNTKNIDDIYNAEVIKKMFPRGFADKKGVKEQVGEIHDRTGIPRANIRKWIKIALLDQDIMEGFKKGFIDRKLLNSLSALSSRYFKGTAHDYEEKLFVEIKKMAKEEIVLDKEGLKNMRDKLKPMDLIHEELKKKLKNSVANCLKNEIEKDEIVHLVKE